MYGCAVKQEGLSALQVWGLMFEQDGEEVESEGKTAFRAFMEAMLAEVL